MSLRLTFLLFGFAHRVSLISWLTAFRRGRFRVCAYLARLRSDARLNREGLPHQRRCDEKKEDYKHVHKMPSLLYRCLCYRTQSKYRANLPYLNRNRIAGG